LTTEEEDLRAKIALLKEELSELQQARRLVMIGRMAVGLAHEINNPLAVIQGRIELMQQMDLTDVRRSKKQLAVIHEHGLRIARTVSNLQAFADPESTRPERLELAVLIERSLLLAERALRNVRVECAVSPNGLTVVGDRAQLEQVFVNLLTNAAEAMRGGGTVRITAQAEGDDVRIAVEDEGGGIPEEFLSELFTPFRLGRSHSAFKRKWELRGAGMGLAIACSIITEHGGAIEATNRERGGVRFAFDLPGERVGVEEPQHVEEIEDTSASALLLLVVEDEQALLDTILEMAESTGYAAEGVTSAEGALERLAENHFDGILTDIRLPGMSGVDLVEVVEEAYPHLVGRVVLMSGLFHPAPPGARYLQKPFSRSQFVDQLAAVMTEGADDDTHD
jgi:CheY-like chemotaxis protein